MVAYSLDCLRGGRCISVKGCDWRGRNGRAWWSVFSRAYGLGDSGDLSRAWGTPNADAVSRFTFDGSSALSHNQFGE